MEVPSSRVSSSDERHTPGPWRLVIAPGMGPDGEPYFYIEAERGARAAMQLVLDLVRLGIARFEVSGTGGFSEFCFDGIRHFWHDDFDYTVLCKSVGWDRMRAALTKAEAPASKESTDG